MKKIASVLMGICFLSGCLSIGTSAPSTFYSLRGINEEEIIPVTQKKARIGIEEIKVPSYLDKPQLVTKSSDSVEVAFSEQHRWSEPLTTMMQRTLANDIALYMPNSLVKARYLGREQFDFLVFVELEKFEGALDGQVRLSGWWYVVDKNGDVIMTQKANLKRKTGGDFNDLVQSESLLVNELGKQIAENLAKKMR